MAKTAIYVPPNEQFVQRTIKITPPQREYLKWVSLDFEEAFTKALTKSRVYLKRNNNILPSLAVIEPPRNYLISRKIWLRDLQVLEIADYGVVDAMGKVRTDPYSQYNITDELGQLRDETLTQQFIQGCMNIINLSYYLSNADNRDWLESHYQERMAGYVPLANDPHSENGHLFPVAI